MKLSKEDIELIKCYSAGCSDFEQEILIKFVECNLDFDRTAIELGITLGVIQRLKSNNLEFKGALGFIFSTIGRDILNDADLTRIARNEKDVSAITRYLKRNSNSGRVKSISVSVNI